jgi:hypothetical protein
MQIFLPLFFYLVDLLFTFPCKVLYVNKFSNFTKIGNVNIIY